jgi:hypothetical protein
MLMGQSDPLARRPGMFAFKCKGEASALGSTSAVLGCSFFIPHRYRPPVNVLNMHVSKARQTNSDTNKQTNKQTKKPCAVQTATRDQFRGATSNVAVANAQWMMSTVLPFSQENREQGA